MLIVKIVQDMLEESWQAWKVYLLKGVRGLKYTTEEKIIGTYLSVNAVHHWWVVNKIISTSQEIDSKTSSTYISIFHR